MTSAHTSSRSSFPVVVAIIGLFLLFWFLTSQIYIDSTEQEEVSNYTVPEQSLQEHRGAADSLLSTSKVTDAENGKVRLSIERAKDLVISENSQ